MYVKYDELDLLELFESEPTSIFDKEAGVFMYTKEDEKGFMLILHLSVYEQTCEASLSFRDYINPIFEFNDRDVESIRRDGDKLIISIKEVPNKMIIHFKPNFSIERVD